jgi:predicted PhzF superfamily epimerase YddE/YHI9
VNPPAPTGSRDRPFRQVDVFAATAGLGNPLAVVLDGDGLDDARMQRFAAWTNLSETTFLLPPTQAGADYRVRIFTPGGELPFAGHPTLGSCHAWLAAGGRPQREGAVVQECAAGLVRIRRGPAAGSQDAAHPRPASASGTAHPSGPAPADAASLAFAAPALRRSAPAPDRLADLLQALGLPPGCLRAAQVLDNGPVWHGLLVDSAETVRGLRPDHARLKELGMKAGVAHVPAELLRPAPADAPPAADPDPGGAPSAPMVTVRAFAAPIGIAEDPVTGSLNASLAQWLIADGLAPRRYTAAQGECLGRAGRVAIAQDAAGQVWVGGQVADCIAGTVRL